MILSFPLVKEVFYWFYPISNIKMTKCKS